MTDIVPEQGPGRRVSPGNPGELADAIDELARDEAARRLAAEAGAELRRRFDPAAVAERFEALYRQALQPERDSA